MTKDRRKQLQMEYQERGQPMGVYRIVCRANGRRLVGSSPNLDGIWNRHRFMLGMGAHTNKRLQQDWNEDGEDGFAFEVLDRLKPRDGEPPTKVRYLRNGASLMNADL